MAMALPRFVIPSLVAVTMLLLMTLSWFGQCSDATSGSVSGMFPFEREKESMREGGRKRREGRIEPKVILSWPLAVASMGIDK
jgi:hypothetical protein